MMTVPLSQGKLALVDDEDFNRVAQFKWHAILKFGIWYARRNDYSIGGRNHPRTEYMHMVILPGVGLVDHKDGNGLDNRKANLRPSNCALNRINSKKDINSTSCYKGVWFCSTSGKWRAQVRLGGRTWNLGTHVSEVEAAEAYNIAAFELFGEFARLNQLPESSSLVRASEGSTEVRGFA